MDSTSMETSGSATCKLSPANLLNWAVQLFKSPKALFGETAKTGSYWTYILYALAWIAVSTLLEFGISRFRPQPVRLSLGAEIAWVAAGPLLTIILGFVVSGVFFVIWHLMGSKENYLTAFRCWALMAPLAVISAVLGLVPFLPLVVFLYGTYLLVVASQQAHGIAAKKAWIVWGSLCAVLLVLVGISISAGRIARSRGLGAFDGRTGEFPQGFPAASDGQLPDQQELQAMAEKMQKQMMEQLPQQGESEEKK